MHAGKYLALYKTLTGYIQKEQIIETSDMVKHELRVTSWKLTSASWNSNPRVMSSNPRVTSPNPRVQESLNH